MSGFSAAWLGLREPADALARQAAGIETELPPRANDAPREVIDLGAGTGANLRYLAPRLAGMQRWTLVDDDSALLAAAADAIVRWAEDGGARVRWAGEDLLITGAGFTCSVGTQVLDLARGVARLALAPGCLVTASALLDLVSVAWLEDLADACRAARAQVLFALTYDGRIAAEPGDPDDAFALECFNTHQRGSKMFGPALGPDASAAALRAFAARGYMLRSAPSDWRLTPAERALQIELLNGWLAAALEIAPDARGRLERWHAAHRDHAAAQRSFLTIGHRDIVGVPP